MKLNLHGIIGTAAILGLLGIAYVKDLTSIWILVAMAAASYTAVILAVTNDQAGSP